MIRDISTMRKGRLVSYLYHDDFTDPNNAAIADNTSNKYRVLRYQTSGEVFGAFVKIENVDDPELTLNLIPFSDIDYINK